MKIQEIKQKGSRSIVIYVWRYVRNHIKAEIPTSSARDQDHWDYGVLEGNKSHSYFARKKADEEIFPAKCDAEMKENVR